MFCCSSRTDTDAAPFFMYYILYYVGRSVNAAESTAFRATGVRPSGAYPS